MTPLGRRMAEPIPSSGAQHPSIELGAYLLAALPADQEAALERHLLQCQLCQGRLVELTEVLPALGQVPVDCAIALTDQTSRPDACAFAVATTALAPELSPAEASPAGAVTRWRVAAAAGGVAAAAVLVLVLVLVAIGSTSSTDRRAAALSSSASTAPVSLVRVFPYTGDDQVTVRAWNSDGGGTEVTVQCHNGRTAPAVIDPNAAVYELWAVRDDGVPYKVSSWKAVYGDDTFPGRLDFPVDRIKSLELRSGGAVLSIVQ